MAKFSKLIQISFWKTEKEKARSQQWLITAPYPLPPAKFSKLIQISFWKTEKEKARTIRYFINWLDREIPVIQLVFAI